MDSESASAAFSRCMLWSKLSSLSLLIGCLRTFFKMYVMPSVLLVIISLFLIDSFPRPSCVLFSFLSFPSVQFLFTPQPSSLSQYEPLSLPSEFSNHVTMGKGFLPVRAKAVSKLLF